MMRSVSTPARIASGLPPKVVPWLPGPSTFAAFGPTTTAPIGTPEPRPLASGITSGTDAGPLVGEPLAGAADAALHLVEHQQPVLLVAQLAQALQVLPARRVDAAFALDGLEEHGHHVGVARAPPRSTAARSFSGTRTKPSTSGPKPFCTFGLPVADSVAIERPWKAFS